MTRATLATAAVAVALGITGPALGQTYSWSNPDGGNWNVGSNWSTGAVPGSGNDALIGLAGTYAVTLNDTRSIGTVTVNQSGATLTQTAGDLTAGGLFSLQAGSLNLTGGRILANGGFSSAEGTTIALNGGQLWVNPLTGGPAIINSTIDWSAGELHGPGSTSTPLPLNGPVNLVGTGTREIDSRGLTQLNGGGTWDAGRLIVDAFTKNFELPVGATVTNTTASGNFRLDGDGSVGSVFNIKGSFIKQGANESMFWQTQVNVSGTLDVQGGRMRLMSHGTHTGTFRVASGATLEFNGQENLNSGSLTVSGTGTLVAGWVGNTTTVASPVTVNISNESTVRVESGGLDFASTSVNLSPQTLEVSNGRLTVRGLTRPNTLLMRAGSEIWGGTDSGVNNDLSIGTSGGKLTWEAGDFTFLRNVTVQGAADLPGTGSRTLWGSISKGVTLNMALNGGGTWDAGEIRMNGRSGITISAGTTVTNTTASGNFSIVPPDATADGGSVQLAGTLIKQGANTLTFGRDITIQNSGHLDVRAGTVVISTDVNATAGGDYTLAAGTTLQVPLVSLRGTSSNPGLLRGVGTLQLVSSPNRAGVLTISEGGRIRPGLGGPGVLTIAGNSHVGINAHDTSLGGPPRLIIATERTGASAANAGRFDVTDGSINFYFPGTTRWVDLEVVGTDLRLGETYTLTIATASDGFRRTDLGALPAGYEFPTGDYRVFSSYAGLQDVRLFLSDTNTLVLQFTPVPVPEPVTVLAAGVAGLGLMRLLRRRVAGRLS